jgi:hypothetical protein
MWLLVPLAGSTPWKLWRRGRYSTLSSSLPTIATAIGGVNTKEARLTLRLELLSSSSLYIQPFITPSNVCILLFVP